MYLCPPMQDTIKPFTIEIIGLSIFQSLAISLNVYLFSQEITLASIINVYLLCHETYLSVGMWYCNK